MKPTVRSPARFLAEAPAKAAKNSWRFARDDVMTAWRKARLRIMAELLLLAVGLTLGIRINMPRFYVEQAEIAGGLAEAAAALSAGSESREGREFFRREASWYGRQRFTLLREAAWLALRGEPTIDDPAAFNRATIHELAITERLELHGHRWSTYRRLAESHRREADRSAETLRRVEAGEIGRADFDRESISHSISNNRSWRNYYEYLSRHPWEAPAPSP